MTEFLIKYLMKMKPPKSFLLVFFLTLFFSFSMTTAFAADAGGDWNPAAGMNLPHVFPSSALLSSGKVLVVGYGVTENGASGSAELYDADIYQSSMNLRKSKIFSIIL